MKISSLKKYVDAKFLIENHIVPWSQKTIERRIKDSGFPAISNPGGGYIFDLDDINDWMKRRKVRVS